jgi:hypothetical protein
LPKPELGGADIDLVELGDDLGGVFFGVPKPELTALLEGRDEIR